MTIDNPTADELAAHEARVERANRLIANAMIYANRDVRLALLCMFWPKNSDIPNRDAAEQYADRHGGNYNEAIAARAWELAGEIDA